MGLLKNGYFSCDFAVFVGILEVVCLWVSTFNLKRRVAMNLRTCLAAFAAVVLVGVGVIAIADDATTNPSTEIRTSTRSRIVAPFNQLTDLTDDQKDKIRDIHAQAIEQERQLRQKEQDDMMAVLTDDQKKELTDLEAKLAAEKKAGSAERRAKTEEERAQQLKQQADGTAAPATQPSGGQ